MGNWVMNGQAVPVRVHACMRQGIDKTCLVWWSTVHRSSCRLCLEHMPQKLQPLLVWVGCIFWTVILPSQQHARARQGVPPAKQRQQLSSPMCFQRQPDWTTLPYSKQSESGCWRWRKFQDTELVPNQAQAWLWCLIDCSRKSEGLFSFNLNVRTEQISLKIIFISHEMR
jgi:hypothetical protein